MGVDLNFKNFLTEQEENNSCISGEWVYFPRRYETSVGKNGRTSTKTIHSEIKFAERSDINRGHIDIIYDFYVKKAKPLIIKAYNYVVTNKYVSKEKIKKQFLEISRTYPYYTLFLPPENLSDINARNIQIYWSALDDLLYDNIYIEDKSMPDDFLEDMQENVKNIYGKDYHALNELSNGRVEPIEFEAMKNYGVIFARANDVFDMFQFDKNKVVECLEAICTKNQNKIYPATVPLRKLKSGMFSPSDLEKTIHINTFSDSKTHSTKSIKIKELIGGETPQKEFDLPKAHLPVGYLSKASQIQTDVLRKQWAQRTSD